MTMAMLTTILMLLYITLVNSQEYQHTIEVMAGTEECYYETVGEGQTITVEYQVVDTGGPYAMMDINFRMMDPRGVAIVAEYRREEGSHSYSRMEGDYKMCFDSFSSSKVVYFDVIVEREDENYDDLAKVFRDGKQFAVEDEYEDHVDEIEEKLKTIKGDILTVAHLQTQIQRTNTRDRSRAEQNINRVDSMSFVLVVVMIGAGMVQVLVVKSLFQPK
eukprot:GFUD01041108.1.p1 GENE.GFUD01041108.1~~GFUD01041108.1.p1  ORF type:complete len:218 (-),score=78.60 GFUD01041108.1:155-808(-)